MIMSLILDPKAPEGAQNVVKDAVSGTFVRDVIEASKEVPVLVGFWSADSEPCQSLLASVEKLVRAAGGAIRLVKMNVEDCMEVVQQLRIQSVPTVYSFKGGRPVDAFQGAIPETEIRKFVNKQMGQEENPIAHALSKAKEALDQGEADVAQAIYMQVLQHDQTNPEACAGVIRSHVLLGSIEAAQQIVDGLPAELKKNEFIASAIAMIELAGQEPVDLKALEAKLMADLNDHQSRFEFAMALYSAQKYESALHHLLEIVKKDRTWKEDGARHQMIKIFEAIGLSDPLVIEYRRKLTTVLY
jgi:putative thioredoxin